MWRLQKCDIATRLYSRILIAKPCAYQNLTRTANNVCAINNIRFVCITFDVYFYFLINYEYRPKNKHFYLHQVWSIWIEYWQTSYNNKKHFLLSRHVFCKSQCQDRKVNGHLLVLGVYILCFFLWFFYWILDFRTVPTVWYFLFFILCWYTFVLVFDSKSYELSRLVEF
jgi:hypothetical protein